MSVEFRVATADDALAMLAIYEPYCTSSNVSFEVIAPTEQQMRERIAGVTERYPWLVAEVEGVVVGYVYANKLRERAAYRWSVEVAVYVALHQQRRGLARALYATLFEVLKLQGYRQAYASITLPNVASASLHESLGFERVGTFPKVGYKLGRWLDVGWWRLELNVDNGEPTEPKKLVEIFSTREFHAKLSDGANAVSRLDR